jgi:poly(3-hydroxybutyrate) depolymerase
MTRTVSFALSLAALLLASASTSFAQAPQPDPGSAQYRARGEQDRSYAFPGTGEMIPYHLYVPSTWDGKARLPLVVVTHGANQPATAPFQRPMADPTLAKTAEARGYIVAAVTGYHANATGVGGWNVPYRMVQVPRTAPAGGRGGRAGGGQGGGVQAGGGRARGPAPAPPTTEDFQRAEQDVLYVADLVAKEYNVDPARIYLMGNSSGGSAVWTYAARHPERWAAISPSAAPLEDEAFPYDALKKTPVLIVHGDMDTVMAFSGSQAMAEHARARGVDATWLPVANGSHTDAWAQPAILAQTFDFFDNHRK